MLQIEQGNTLRIEIEFMDFDGQPVDPDNIVFKIYDLKYIELSSNPLSDNNKVRNSNGDFLSGKYYIDYVFDKSGTYYIEFLGYVDGKPTLKREKIAVVFI